MKFGKQNENLKRKSPETSRDIITRYIEMAREVEEERDFIKLYDQLQEMLDMELDLRKIDDKNRVMNKILHIEHLKKKGCETCETTGWLNVDLQERWKRNFKNIVIKPIKELE